MYPSGVTTGSFIMHPMKGQKMFMGNSTARLRETGSMRYSESNGIHIVEVGDVVW